MLCALYVRTFMPQEQQAEGRERMRVLQSRRSGPLPTVGTTLNQAQVAKPVLPAVGAAVVDSAPADVVPGTLSESPKENRDETPST